MFSLISASMPGVCTSGTSNLLTRYCGTYLGLRIVGVANSPICGKLKRNLQFTLVHTFAFCGREKQNLQTKLLVLELLVSCSRHIYTNYSAILVDRTKVSPLKLQHNVENNAFISLGISVLISQY